MQQTPRPWPELAKLDLLLAREGMARGPDVWLNIHALLLSRLSTQPELSVNALARLLGPLVCKNPQQQQCLPDVISEWLEGKVSAKIEVAAPVMHTTASATSAAKTAKQVVLQRFQRRYAWLVLLLLACLAVAAIKQFSSTEEIHPPKSFVSANTGTQTESGTTPKDTVAITNWVAPNPLPMPRATIISPTAYWAWLVSVPALFGLLWLVWQYWPQLILRKHRQDDEVRLTGLKIQGIELNPGIPFSGAKIIADLSPLMRPGWIKTRRLQIADTVTASANNFGFFTPVYQQRSQRPEYVVLVQSLYARDQFTELAEQFLHTLQATGKSMRVRGYRFRDDPHRLYPIATVQPGGEADSAPLSLSELADKRGDARLIIISNWDIAFVPYQINQPQLWVEELQGLYNLQHFVKRLWLCPGHATARAAELAKQQAQRLNIRLLPLASDNLKELASWLSQEHDPLVPPGQAEAELFPASLTATAESWLSWRPPQGIQLKQLIHELRSYLGAKGFLLLQALAVFPKPIWPLPFILDQQLFPRTPATNEPEESEQRLLAISRLPWSRHAFMPDYLRELLLKSLNAKERRSIRLAWDAIIAKFALQEPDGPVDIPIDASAIPKTQLQHFLLRQEEGNALDDAIFANILLGGKLGLLDFKLPRALGQLLPDTLKILDIRPALLALGMVSLSIGGLHYAWQHGAEQQFREFQDAYYDRENSQWQVTLNYRDNTQALAAALQHNLAQKQFPASSQLAVVSAVSNNMISYPPGGESAARRIQQSLTWLTYGAEVRLTVDKALSPPTLWVELAQTYQHASGFNDPLVYKVLEPEMVRIPPGQFLMGSPANEPDRSDYEGPQHQVTIAYAFELSATEVTFAQYDQFAESTGRKKPDDRGWGRADRPVINVSFGDAVAYTQWLTAQTGKQYRLPSEAEWEYAARAGATSAYWWGQTIGKNNAVCDGCGSQWDNQQTAPVKSFKANAFGLYDTAGNVWEWTQDCWHDSYEGAPLDGSAWLMSKQEDCELRVTRGGSWVDGFQIQRSSGRVEFKAVESYFALGFRVASTL